jgi:hypothetical protein
VECRIDVFSVTWGNPALSAAARNRELNVPVLYGNPLEVVNRYASARRGSP